jgi:hypothetical protein
MSTGNALDLVLAYRTTNEVAARSLAAYLENAGIESQVVGEFLGGAYAGLSFGRMNEREVWVAEKDKDEATKLVAEWEREYEANSARPANTDWPRKILWVISLLLLLFFGVAWASAR